MVRHQYWHQPAVLKKVRGRITVVLYIILACILLLNAGTINQFIKNIF